MSLNHQERSLLAASFACDIDWLRKYVLLKSVRLRPQMMSEWCGQLKRKAIEHFPMPSLSSTPQSKRATSYPSCAAPPTRGICLLGLKLYFNLVSISKLLSYYGICVIAWIFILYHLVLIVELLEQILLSFVLLFDEFLEDNLLIFSFQIFKQSRKLLTIFSSCFSIRPVASESSFFFEFKSSFKAWNELDFINIKAHYKYVSIL